MWAELYSLVMESNGGCWKKVKIFGLNKKSEISLPSAWASASQERVFTFCWLWRRCVIFFLRYRSFVNFWPIKFSSGRVGTSHLYNYSDSGLEDETKVPCPRHLTYRLGPSASPNWVFMSQKLSSDQYMVNKPWSFPATEFNKFSRAESRVKIGRFSDVLVTDSVPIFSHQFLFYQTTSTLWRWRQGSRNVRKPSHLDASVCPSEEM
jgi:hypothetical protein